MFIPHIDNTSDQVQTGEIRGLDWTCARSVRSISQIVISFANTSKICAPPQC